MYEAYYGFAEKPFSLTPDPKYLYRSQSHANAFELLQYAIQRREGFVVVTGDIGTGKTTICRALLEQIDRTTFTALVLNPFLSEEDLLKRILQDFGVVSRENVRAGQLTGVTKQDLIETLYDFLLGLIPLKANAVLIIDEAQNLPLPVLEQIRILSNLETDKDKLLQIILVGQLDLGDAASVAQSSGSWISGCRFGISWSRSTARPSACTLPIASRSPAARPPSRSRPRRSIFSTPVGRHSAPHQSHLRSCPAVGVLPSARIALRSNMVAHAAESLDVGLSSSVRLTPQGASLAGAATVMLAASAFSVGSTAFSISDSPIGRSRQRASSDGRARRPSFSSQSGPAFRRVAQHPCGLVPGGRRRSRRKRRKRGKCARLDRKARAVGL